MNCLNLNLQAYECFKTLFVGVNAQDALTVERDSSSLQVKSLTAIQGMNTLWKVAIYCQNEAVKDLCRSLLCDLFLSLPKNQS
jgi:hypothetical protein